MFPHKETMTFCIIKNRATCYTTCFPIPANAQIHVFTVSGGVCGAYDVAPLPCYKNGIHKIRMHPGRGAKAYALRTFPKETKRLANAQKRSFAASGGVCGAYAIAPLSCYRNGIHKIRMYPGRGVLHTPPERFRRKRRGVPMHKNDHSPPPAAFVGRMLLRHYRITGMESEK